MTSEKNFKNSHTYANIPYGYQIFVRFALSLTVSEIKATSCFRGHMTLNGVKCKGIIVCQKPSFFKLLMQNIPYGYQIFVRFALSLTVSEIKATSCFGGHMTSEKNFQNPSLLMQVYPTGTKFSSVSLYLLPFPR